MHILPTLNAQLERERALVADAEPRIKAAEDVEVFLRAKNLTAIAHAHLESNRCDIAVYVHARYEDLINALEHVHITPELVHDSAPIIALRTYHMTHRDQPVTLLCMPPLPQIVRTTYPAEVDA